MLILPIKKKWFDMILSGYKREEYRKISPYYASRFRDRDEEFKVLFRNGYSSKSPSFVAICSLGHGMGLAEWGAEPNVCYYILRIIEIIEVSNIEGQGD